MGLYVNYGCGKMAPESWTNFDASPTLRMQNILVLGSIFKNNQETVFPSNVKYGDIVKGLPLEENSCDGIYCSHVLEHLSLNDFMQALKNTYRVLKPGGIFRCVVPDLETYARDYITALDAGDDNASIDFVGHRSLFGQKSRTRGLKAIVSNYYGNSRHLWMWDKHSLKKALSEAGFVDVRDCEFNDSTDEMFKEVEQESRFREAVAVESKK